MLTLQGEPELRAVAKVAPKTHRCVGRNRTATIENISDKPRGHADIERQSIGAELAGCQFALQQAAGLNDRNHDGQPFWRSPEANSRPIAAGIGSAPPRLPCNGQRAPRYIVRSPHSTVTFC